MNSTLPLPNVRITIDEKAVDKVSLIDANITTQIHSTSNIENIFYKFFELAAYSVIKTEPLEKLTKNIHRGLDVFVKLQLITDIAVIGLSSSLKAAVEVFESIRFLGLVSLITTPQKNNKYFLSDPQTSIQKKCDRLLVTGHSGCKTVRTLNKWKLIDLGNFGKLKIGAHLTVFHLITDSLMIASSAFGLWDLSLKMKEYELEKQGLVQKIDKWDGRALSLAKILVKDAGEIERFRYRSEKKVLDIRAKIEWKQKELSLNQRLLNQAPLNLDIQDLVKESMHIQKEIDHLEKKLNKNQRRYEQLKMGDYESFVKETSQKNILSKKSKFEALKKNLNSTGCLNIVKVASSVTKIFVIAMAMALTAVNVWSTLPVIVLLSLGIVSDTLGLAKILADKKNDLPSLSHF